MFKKLAQSIAPLCAGVSEFLTIPQSILHKHTAKARDSWLYFFTHAACSSTLHVLGFSSLFADTEVFEDNVQDLLWPDSSRDAPQVGEGAADPLSGQSQVSVLVAVELSEGGDALLQVSSVPGLCQRRASGQGVTTQMLDSLVQLCEEALQSFFAVTGDTTN